MAILFSKLRQFVIGIPLGAFAIIVYSVSPFLVGFTGGYITQLITGEECNEGNSIWGVLPWFMFVTLPTGAGLLCLFIIIAIIDAWKFEKKQNITVTSAWHSLPTMSYRHPISGSMSQAIYTTPGKPVSKFPMTSTHLSIY